MSAEQVIHLTGDYWGVILPTLFCNPGISIQPDEIPCITYWYGDNIDPSVISLPPGMWSILSLAKDLREEQWRGIVEWYTDSHDSSYDPMYNVTTYFDVFKDYVTGDEGELATATQSGHSLLVSKNLQPETTLIIKKEA